MRKKRVASIGIAILVLAVVGWAAPKQSEEEKIEEVVAAVLDAYRTANYQVMARYYAPEVTMVSGLHQPLITGWENVRQAYLAQEARLKHVEFVRHDTLIRYKEKFAWVYYRWTFVGQVGQENVTTLGHTTLVLEKHGRHWLIVHNHTSAVAPPAPPTQAPSPPSPRQ